MNVFVGLVFLIVGVLAALTGILLAVREALGPRRGLYAGRNLQGIAGVINAAAALFDAIKGVPLSALFLLLGLIFMVFGTWVLGAQPIKAKPLAATSSLWLSKNPSVSRVTPPPPGLFYESSKEGAAAKPNKRVQPTPYSLRSFLALAFKRG